jgi:hypothetical protein
LIIFATLFLDYTDSFLRRTEAATGWSVSSAIEREAGGVACGA